MCSALSRMDTSNWLEAPAGKSYCAMQMTMESIHHRKRVLILDVAHSYTPEELRKADVPDSLPVCCRNPVDEVVTLSLPEESGRGAERAANLLRKAFQIDGAQQYSVLAHCCKTLLEQDETLSFPALFAMLDSIAIDADHPRRAYAAALCNRFVDYQSFDGIRMKRTAAGEPGAVAPMTVLQFSDLEEKQRCDCSMLALEWIWCQIRDRKRSGSPPPWDIVLVDEFQNLSRSLRAGCALYAFLREGRKYNVSAWVASQYENIFDADTQEALNQCANKLYFRPTPRQMKSTARMLSENHREWQPVLRSLRQGEAILDGTVRYAGSRISVSGCFKVTVWNGCHQRKDSRF